MIGIYLYFKMFFHEFTSVANFVRHSVLTTWLRLGL